MNIQYVIMFCRCLISALYEANRVDLIDELQCLTTLQSIPLQPIPPHKLGTVRERIRWYGRYLRKQYVEVLFISQLSVNIWLPSPSQKIFNLAIIKKQKIQRGKLDDRFVHQTIRGQVDDILLDKSPIKLKDLFKNIKGERKVILIDGAPGSGKSTLTVHICQEWGRGKLFNEFTVVILVQLRDPTVQSAKSIADLLPCDDRAMAKQAASDIMSVKGSSVLWILDGWDELPSHLQKGSIISALVRPTLHQNPLSKTTVIVTSRPISSGELCNLVSSRVEVLGFTSEEQRLFFTECLGNEEAVETLIERLSSNPAMEGSCSLPLNALIVAHLYLTTGSLPSTIFGIFSSLVKHILSRYLCERKGMIDTELATFESLDKLPPELQAMFEQLCKLAFMGTRANKITFSSSDLDDMKVSKEVCEVGLLQAVPSIVSHGRSVYHNFVHLSIQEMLSAVHISKMSASEQISTFDSMFNESRFSAVFQFYSAITKLRTSRPLLSLVPHFMRPIPASIYDLVRKIIRNNSPVLSVSLLNCLYEAQDISLCKYVGEQFKSNIPFLNRLFGVEQGTVLDLNVYPFLSRALLPLLPRDCLSIGYFLASVVVSCKGKFEVSLFGCYLEDVCTKILMQSLCRSLDPHSKITGHLCIHLTCNGITEKGARYIAEVLRATGAFGKLDLSDNSLGSEGLQSIVDAMITNTSLVELHLSNCSLSVTKENGPTLTQMLQRNKTLRELDLSCNLDLSDRQASIIINGLKENTTLTTLNLDECKFTDEGIRFIQSSTSTCKIIKY